MHPAYSVIFFTTASGAGYGLLALMGVLGAEGLLPADRWFGAAGLAIALGLVTFGLLSSTFHLGHPERAWRAYSQWRSSWLSREGVVATATYAPALLYAAGWVGFEDMTGIWGVFGVITALMAGVTVYCTAMIYVSLKPIHAWHNRWVAPNYFALALLTGTLLLNALMRAFGAASPGVALLAAAAALLAFYLKRSYWLFIDTTASASTVETATGLGNIGKVRLLEPPHTQPNFVQREMGYAIARKHARKLRRIAFLALFAGPLVLSLVAMGSAGWLGTACALLAVVCAAVGVVVERWLFFAEARHAVTLYYGAEAA